MTPLIIVPARQLSEGRPCKNREAWPALEACLNELPADWWAPMIMTDDPWIVRACGSSSSPWQTRYGTAMVWQHMDARHTVAQVARFACARVDYPYDAVAHLPPG